MFAKWRLVQWNLVNVDTKETCHRVSALSGCPYKYYHRHMTSFYQQTFLLGLCSSRAWWSLAPNFCSWATRKSQTFHTNLACENIRFSSLFVAGDVSRGGTSATQWQKFHTDEVKSVRNPVRSADWSTQQLHCFSYCLWMTDKRQKATKVKCKREESLTKPSIFVEYSLL